MEKAKDFFISMWNNFSDSLVFILAVLIIVAAVSIGGLVLVIINKTVRHGWFLFMIVKFLLYTITNEDSYINFFIAAVVAVIYMIGKAASNRRMKARFKTDEDFSENQDDYYRETYTNQESSREQEKREQGARQSQSSSDFVFFTHCKTKEQLSRMYKKLSLIYHPDCETGDANKFKEMQAEYERAMKMY